MVSFLRHRKITCLIVRISVIVTSLYFLREICDTFSGHVIENNDNNLEAFPKQAKTTNYILLKPHKIVKDKLKQIKSEVLNSREKFSQFNQNDLFPWQPPRLPKISSSNRREGKSVTRLTENEFFEKLHSQNGGVTKDPLDFKSVEICLKESQCLPFNDYATWKAQNLALLINNHLDPDRVPPTLKPYPEEMIRPNPFLMVQDTSMNLDTVFLRNQLDAEKKRRMLLGDDDLLRIPEVQRAMQLPNGIRIPNMVHFVWFGCRRYKLYHFASMLSALRHQNPDLILLHTNCVPTGSYWNTFQKAAGNTLMIIQRSPPQDVFGNKFKNVEHQSDVARLQILLEVGGIYMDDDVYILKSLDELRIHEMVLGEENYDALANSVIMASKNAWFLHRWYQEYKRFNGTRWSDSSCFVPWSLWRFFPGTITVVKEKMLRPNWEEIDYTYILLWDWRKSYTIHLFSRYMNSVDGVDERSMEEISVLNTTYGEVTRYVIWGDHHIRNPIQILLGAS